MVRCEMPDRRRRNCMCCGKPVEEVGPISWSGNCLACAEELLRENIVGISTKRGYAARRWARGMRDKADAMLLDANQPEA